MVTHLWFSYAFKNRPTQSSENLGGSENTLYDIMKMNICHYKFVKTHRMYNMRSEPEGKLGTFRDYDVSR